MFGLNGYHRDLFILFRCAAAEQEIKNVKLHALIERKMAKNFYRSLWIEREKERGEIFYSIIFAIRSLWHSLVNLLCVLWVALKRFFGFIDLIDP